jgi:hypothetical protein
MNRLMVYFNDNADNYRSLHLQRVSSGSVRALSKACEIFILELTAKAYQNMYGNEDNVLKVRTS